MKMEELRYGYLLPIGSVVKLKDNDQRVMITGVLQNSRAVPGRTFDYIAVPYPEGMHDSRLNLGFDRSDIEEVVFRGYEDGERNGFLLILEAASRAMEKQEKERQEEDR